MILPDGVPSSQSVAISSENLHGQGASATVEEAAGDMEKLRNILREYEPECVYNVDETGLFLNSFPSGAMCYRRKTRKR